MLVATGILAFASAPAGADFQQGLAAFKRADYSAALDAWRTSARADDYRSQYGLGILYKEGKGVDADAVSAAQWFRRSARHDFADAQVELGLMRASGRDGIPQDAVQAFVWFFLAVENGSSDAVAMRDLVSGMLTEAEHEAANVRIADWQVGIRGAESESTR